jgi:hypothetical protein
MIRPAEISCGIRKMKKFMNYLCVIFLQKSQYAYIVFVRRTMSCWVYVEVWEVVLCLNRPYNVLREADVLELHKSQYDMGEIRAREGLP